MNSRELKNSLKGYKNLGRYLKYFGRYKLLCCGFWLCLIVGGILSFLVPIYLGKMINAMNLQMFSEAKRYAIIMFSVEISAVLINILKTPFFKNLENKVKIDVKLEVIKDAFNINIGTFEEMGNGLFITRLTTNLNSLANSFRLISETIVSSLSKIAFVFYIFIYNAWLGFFLIAFVILRYYVYRIRIYYFSILAPKVHRTNEIVNSTVGESIRGIKDIKVLNFENEILNIIKKQQIDVMKADNKDWYVGISLVSAANAVSHICNLLFVFLSVFLITQGSLDVSIFYTVYLYKNSVLDFAVYMGNIQDYLKEIEVNAYRVFELSNEEIYKHDTFGDLTLKKFRGNVEFKNVYFEYEENKPILKGISFKANPNSHIAFVGESGCGKSTIVALINKLYNSSKGDILLDGVNINSLSREMFNSISMVNQFPYLFNDTIKNNMLFVKPDATDREIWKALRLANAEEFVKELPDKLNSFLGEGGARLSGGQKQRICIARAMLKPSKILIFDEATSALDNLSQEKVIENLNEIKKDKTLITIAHRFSTIESCDTIYFLNKGKILASGTHKELLNNCKKYAKLYNQQLEEQKRLQEKLKNMAM